MMDTWAYVFGDHTLKLPKWFNIWNIEQTVKNGLFEYWPSVARLHKVASLIDVTCAGDDREMMRVPDFHRALIFCPLRPAGRVFFCPSYSARHMYGYSCLGWVLGM